MPPRLPSEIHDFSRVKTVYQRKFRYKTHYGRKYRSFVVKLPDDLHRYPRSRVAPSVSVEEVLREVYACRNDNQCHFLILVMDSAQGIFGYKVLASGNYDRLPITLALVYRNALLLGAHAIVCAHNHTDGTLEPSPEDLKLTRLLLRGAKSLHMEMLDHYIYTPRACASIRERHPHLWPAAKKSKKGSAKEDVR